jgi:dTDP-4-dehydrorhamnose reductase
MRKTVLIFGISSFVGSNLVEVLKDEFRVVGTYLKTPVNIPGVTCYPCDVLKKDYVTRLISKVKPDFTIYAVGLSSLSDCKQKPKLADALNSSGAANVCSASERYRSKFVLISSAYVHGGENLTYTEGDTPFPTTAFGNSLSSAEFYVQRSCLNYLILRCGNLYGRSFRPEHPNWYEFLERSLAKGEKFLCDDSVKGGFLDIQILGRILKQALKADVTNRLLHVSSTDVMSRFEFARTFAKIFRFDENLIVKTTVNFPLERRPGKDFVQDFSFRLGVGNIEEFLGTKMPSTEDSLNFTKKRLEIFSEKNS